VCQWRNTLRTSTLLLFGWPILLGGMITAADASYSDFSFALMKKC